MMTKEQQAIWSLVVEIGGNPKLFGINPHLEGAWKRGIELLTEQGVIDEEGVLAKEHRGLQPGRAPDEWFCDITIYDRVTDVAMQDTPMVMARRVAKAVGIEITDKQDSTGFNVRIPYISGDPVGVEITVDLSDNLIGTLRMEM